MSAVVRNLATGRTHAVAQAEAVDEHGADAVVTACGVPLPLADVGEAPGAASCPWCARHDSARAAA